MPKNRSSILIVDDEYYLGQILAQALTQERYETVAVTDVDTAIDWLNKKNFDLVISDIYLPKKTGMDLFSYARDEKMEVPFIFMTGNPNLETAVNFLTQGGYDYIIKPFMIPNFIRKVKATIQTHREKTKEKNLVNDLKYLLDKRINELIIYQDVFESTDDGLIIIDIEGNIVKVNGGFEKLTGLSTAQLLDRSLKVLKETVLPGLPVRDILEKIQVKTPWRGELLGNHGDSSGFYVNISFFPIMHKNSEIFAYAGLFKDVTAQRRAEEALITSLRNMNLAQEAIIFGLAKLAENRDSSTGFHLERICNYSKVLAEALQERGQYPEIITSDFINMLYRIAPIHDIGKVGIPDYILLKKGKLTSPEFEIMKSHVKLGYDILKSIHNEYGDTPYLKMGIEVTHYHHERWNGTGYMAGLKGDEIPLSAQIVAVADVYDALTTERSYKKAFSHQKAIQIMKKERGEHFAPNIFDVFADIADRFNTIRLQYSEKTPAFFTDDVG